MSACVAIVDICCCECGFCFWIPASTQSSWKKKERHFFCPSCRQEQWYSNQQDRNLKKDIENLEQLNEKLKRDMDHARQFCPICEKYYQRLDLHLSRTHKDERERLKGKAEGH